MSIAVSLRLTPGASSQVLRQEPGGAWGTLGWRPPLSTKVSAGWPCGIGPRLCDVPRLDQVRTHAARSRCVAVITCRWPDSFRAGHDAVLDSTLDKQRSEKGAIERCF